ncbi:S-adenosyl-L-methionine-dependent methyltransferase [Sporodiniella umbellata]|nr:S-adenosyl-L-methionine-dependent methyltransferase [Sporodiniella umbellata]
MARSEYCPPRYEEELYADSYSTPIPDQFNRVLSMLAEYTQEKLPNAFMMVSPLQSKVLYQLTRLLQAQNILEIGGLTGYSAIAMASALGEQGKLISLELEPEYIKISREYIQTAGLQHKIQVIQGPAKESLLQLAKDTPKLKYDLIFIVLFCRQVHRIAGFEEDDTTASKNVKKTAGTIHKFNEHVSKDPRSEMVLLPIFDGITLIRKKNVL